MYMLKNKIAIQFVIFILVGASSALLDLYLLYALRKINLNINLSITIAYISGALLNYLLHTFLTFKKTTNKKNLSKFITVLLINYSLTLIIIYILLQLNTDLIIAKIISLPVIAVIGFILARNWIYKI